MRLISLLFLFSLPVAPPSAAVLGKIAGLRCDEGLW